MDAQELLERYAAGERRFRLENLQDLDLKGQRLAGIDLRGANLRGADLSNADLTADLLCASLQNTKLRRACLAKANLEKVDLQKTDLKNAILKDANLQKADLTDANLYGALLEGANFTHAIMPDGEIYRPSEDSPQKPSLGDFYSMPRQIIKTEHAPAPVGPYNQAIIASGDLLFVSGQIAINPADNMIVHTDSVTKQTEQVMVNIEAILQAAGYTLQDVVKTTVFLADMNSFAEMNEVYSRYFDSETAPARACVEVSRLPKDALVEIECIAVI